MQELTQKLEAGVQAVYSSEAWREVLALQARFHNYSFSNTILIWLQMPNASRVAGFNTWKSINRHVVKGSKAIKILAPIIGKKTEENEDGEETEKTVIHGFRRVNVFDISQTGGEDLPRLIDELDGDSKAAEYLITSLESVIKIPFQYENITGASKGYYSPSEHRIIILKGMSKDQTAKTIIHEYAHSLLHHKNSDRQGKTRGQIEAEAEGTAFVVSTFYGLDTSDYSFGYVAGWASQDGGAELVRSIGQTIQRTAHQIITAIEQQTVPIGA